MLKECFVVNDDKNKENKKQKLHRPTISTSILKDAINKITVYHDKQL